MNRWVMMTLLLFVPARARLGRFCDIYCTVILSSILLCVVLSVTFCGAVVLKVMDEKTFVKRRCSYKVRITVCI